MNKDAIRQLVNIIALSATITINILANALPLNGLTTEELSDRFQVYFLPAGYVFSIWGLIYAALVAFTIYQALPSQRTNPHLRRIGYLFALSCLANCLWLLLWHYEYFVLAPLAMLMLLFTLITIYVRLDIGRAAVSRAEKWLIHLPFQMYLGWITVATIANVTTTLDYLRWNVWGILPEWWAVIMLAAGFLIATTLAFTRRDPVYVLVLVWAYGGIAIKQSATPLVAIIAWVAAILLLAIAGIVAFSRRPKPAISPTSPRLHAKQP